MGGEKKREPTERVGLSFPATIQSAQEVGESLGKPLLEKVSIQHAKLVTDGADCSTATVPGVLNSAIGRFASVGFGMSRISQKRQQDERCSPRRSYGRRMIGGVVFVTLSG